MKASRCFLSTPTDRLDYEHIAAGATFTNSVDFEPLNNRQEALAFASTKNQHACADSIAARGAYLAIQSLKPCRGAMDQECEVGRRMTRRMRVRTENERQAARRENTDVVECVCEAASAASQTSVTSRPCRTPPRMRLGLKLPVRCWRPCWSLHLSKTSAASALSIPAISPAFHAPAMEKRAHEESLPSNRVWSSGNLPRAAEQDLR